MKFQIKPLVIFLSSLSCLGAAYGSSDSQTQLLHQLKSMNHEMQQLQHQVSHLQGQVNTLKTKLHHKQLAKHQSGKTIIHSDTKSAQSKHGVSPKSDKKNQKMRSRLKKFGTSVVTGPFTSAPTYYNGSNLIVNSPSINEDVSLLRRRARNIQDRQKMGLPPAPDPRLVLSGELEGIAQYSNSFQNKSTSDLNLSAAQIDFFAEVTPWVNGFMSLAYDDAPPDTSANRVDNSRIYLDKGFITIGNLMKSPLYGSIGQIYLPFGRYSSSLISSPLTEFIGKTKARALVVGYHHHQPVNQPYGEAFLFRSASNNDAGRVNSYGADVGYAFKLKKTTGKLGVSYISNIADSLGFQDNGLSGSSTFQGFDQNSSTEDLAHDVNGGDIHAVFEVGPLVFVTEYVTALRTFSSDDLTFNGHGAKPSALNTEATYTFHLFHRPSTFTLNYGVSSEALGLNLPEKRYGVAFQTAVVRDTLLTLEYLHNINYGKSDTAAGKNMSAYTADDLGKSSNVVSAELAVYF